MKKGWKIFWIISGVAAVVGVVLLCVAFALGVSAADFGNSRLFHWGSTKTMPATTDEFTNVRQLDAELKMGTLRIEQYDGNTVRVETEDLEERMNFKCYQDDDGELIIEAKGSHFFGGNHGNFGIIYVYVPRNSIFEDVSLELGAGELYADQIAARSLDVKVGAGNAVIEGYRANEVDVECGTGELTADGEFTKEADVKCGVGDVDFTVPGNAGSYDYELKCGIGKINIGGETYSGLGRSKQIHNGSGKFMDVKCGVGNVNVDFN